MKRILVIVDTQRDFLGPDGSLFNPAARGLVESLDAYLKTLPAGAFDAVVITQDTHGRDEPQKSGAHCIPGTKGWDNLLDLSSASHLPLYFMMKGANDMWTEQKDASPLYQVFPVAGGVIPGAAENGMPRDAFFGELAGADVTVAGYAANYCVQDAMLGFLKRGASVTVREDLVRGINTGRDKPDRAGSGNIRDVVALGVFRKYVERGLLSVLSAPHAQKKSPHSRPAP